MEVARFNITVLGSTIYQYTQPYILLHSDLKYFSPFFHAICSTVLELFNTKFEGNNIKYQTSSLVFRSTLCYFKYRSELNFLWHSPEPPYY